MGKSGKHRNENTFKFQSFSERITSINIDVIHQVRHIDDTPEGSNFYFGQALQKWIELNCTDNFTDFKHEVYEQVQTFEQLVHHEDYVVEALKKHLMIPNSMALEALLDLVVQLARDLQSDFYRHFREFFDILIQLLNKHPQDSDLLEHLFTCFSYLFKFLWRYLVKDIKEVYGFFSPLIGKPYKEYVRNFAAESFAFLMRKAKDHSGLFDFLFSSLNEHPDTSAGLGRLLFEMLKGVKFQFHSTSVTLFPIVLSKLAPADQKSHDQLPLEQIEVALTTTLTSMLNHAKQEFMTPLLEILMTTVMETYDLWVTCSRKDRKQTVSDSLERFFRLLRLCISYKHGTSVAKPDTIAKGLIKMLKGACMCESTARELLEVTSCLLNNFHSQLAVENTSRVISLVFKTKYSPALVYDFTRELFAVPIFEKNVLPSLMPYCLAHMLEKTGSGETTLLFLTQLLLTKSPPPKDSSSFDATCTYMLDFGVGLRSSAPDQILLTVLDSGLECTSGLAKLWSALVCLPHIRPLQNKEAVVKEVVDLGEMLREKAVGMKDKMLQDALLYVMSQSVISLMMMEDVEEIYRLIPLDTMVSCLKEHSSNVAVLRMTEIYLSQVAALKPEADNLLSHDLFQSIFPFLQTNLSSSVSKVRLLSLRILTLFSLPLPVVETPGQQVDVFSVCLSAETVPITVHRYREKMMHLQKLDFTLIQNSIPIGANLQQVPLRYLMGCLFWNFKLLWEPIKKLITSHAEGLPLNVFWDVYGQTLRYASEKSENSDRDSSPETTETDDSFSSLSGLFHQQMSALVEEEERVDFTNYRRQLWTAMQDFPEKCEPRSKEFVPLLFRFLKNEYYLADLSMAPTQNILKYENRENEDVEMDMDIDIEGTEQTAKAEGRGSKKGDVDKNKNKRKGGATGTLIVQLQLLSKMKNPKSLTMEQQLRDLYYELLVHKNPGVQKAAYDCLLTYRDKYLLPYKENFDRLLDDETFRNEIVMFSIDHDNSVVNADHRPQLLPILMRILYGKMQVKTGKGTSGKSHSGFRQSIVLRFLTGCTHEELTTFIELIFSPYKQFMAENPYEMVKDIRQNIDFTKMLPVKKMAGALSSIEIIMKKLGHLLDHFIPSLLKIILGLSTVCGICLENREKLTPYVVSVMKTVRQATIGRLNQFMEEFDNYEYTAVEIDALFEAIVWPQVERLHFEGVYHPTPLMKLFSTWTKVPRFFPLLGKFHESNEENTPLRGIFRLLLSKDVSKGVADFILQMVNSLLVPSENREANDEEEEKMVEDFDYVIVNNLPTSLQTQGTADGSLGVKLLMPHVAEIFQYLHGTIDSLKSNLKQNHRELNILSRISCYVTDVEQCNTLVGLLLPFLGRKMSRSPHSEEAILVTVINLLKVLPDVQHFYRAFVKLLVSISSRVSRKLLCDILKVICDRNEKLKEVPGLLFDLNSWNKRHAEEPDYEVRLEAFQRAGNMVKSMETMETESCLALIYNACHCIIRMEDMSLRESGTHCIVTIVKQFGHAQYSKRMFNDLIAYGLLVEVKQGLRHKNEEVRHEFVTVLKAMVDMFPAKPLFSDLAALRHESIEVDFFENIRHIQMYRRSKALVRLVNHFKQRTVPKEVIAAYYLPLVSCFLVNDFYKKQAALRDAAVTAMGVICRQLPWNFYLQQLKFYLALLPRKLENLKMLVRLIVAILNAFHFDISQSRLDMKKLPAIKDDAEESKSNEKADDKVEREKSDENKEESPDTPAEMTEENLPEIEEQENAADVSQDKEDDTSQNSQVKVDSTPEEEVEEIPEAVYKSKWKQLCSPELATTIHSVILKSVIFQLQKILTAKAKSDDEHKLAKKKQYAEDEEILRVPLALAMVKLLQKLPKGALERHLPGILLKVCQFLKSRSTDIRNAARGTLAEIQGSLGPHFFPFVLSQLKGTLKRGYQVHVLCYTVHMLLHNMGRVIKPGDIDVCLPSLHEVFKEEIFGEVGEEKEVEGIVAKVFEARSSKSYESYQLLARYVSKQSLMVLISPLKQTLETTSSHKSARKVQEVLKKVITGLLENKDVDLETMMVFTHGLIADTLPLTAGKKEMVEEEVYKPGQQPKSCLLLPATPPRGGFKPKPTKKTNLHILVEFGLQLLNINLKRQKLSSKNKKHLQMLDPIIPLLADCLYSKYIRVNSTSLRCLCWLLKFPVPSVKQNIANIANGMFILLKNYASAGAAKGDNLELVTMSFKAVTVLVREVSFYKIKEDQLRVLLTFCEEDLYDYNRQSTAFSLLRAILTRKLGGSEVRQLIEKVQEMSVTADSAHVRRECRQVALQYILDYPLGKKIPDHLQFFVSQLSYEMETGRESALEMMATFFAKFPPTLLAQKAAFFFIPMSVALVNDESPKCKKLTALAIKSLLEKLDHNNRNNLFSVALRWFKDKKLQHRMLAAQLMGLFVEVESTSFEGHLTELLPIIEQQIEPGQFKNIESETVEQGMDHMLYNILNTLVKILRECTGIVRDPRWCDNMNTLWEYIKSHLLYPHVWVQLASSQLYGLLFAAWQPQELVTMEAEDTDNDTATEFLKTDTLQKLRGLVLDFIGQLRSPLLNEELATQVLKNMVFIAKVAKLEDARKVKLAEEKEQTDEDDDEETGADENGNLEEDEEGEKETTVQGTAGKVEKSKGLNIEWMIRKMVREAHHEAIYNSKVAVKRCNVFKWIAAVSLDLGAEVLPSVLHIIMPPIQRELTNQTFSQDETLKTLSQEVLDVLKKIVGFEKFTAVYASTQRQRTFRKGERKRMKAVQAISNPEAFAKRKLKKNLAKKEAKKRKIEQFRPSKKSRKRKYEEMVIKT